MRLQGAVFDGTEALLGTAGVPLPGVKEFVAWLQKEKKQFLFLTNSSERSPLELRKKLQAMGLDIEESHFTPAPWPRPHFLKTPGPRLFRLHHRGPRAHERPV